MPSLRRGARALLILAAALLAAPAAAGATTVLVQGTTDVRDAGLLEDVIEPGFHAAYPQYEVKYIAVGTGQAITNVKAGQGDALLVHAPTQEKTFLEEGYSAEPRGRAVFYSDYVIPGPLGDPAGVLAGAPHNAALAFELVAKAGAEGKANFVSRGDKSGTNTQELAIWKLTRVELNEAGEPGPKGTKELAPWYHKGGGGQAETVLLTQQCPFTGGNCYEMTDRGTFNRLVGNGSVTALQIVSQQNEAAAPGGSNLLTNPFVVYAINPAKFPGVNVNSEGAKALVEYLTSAAFQNRLATYPSPNAPAFFADAHPRMTAGPAISGTFPPNSPFTVSGSLANLLPGSPAVAGVPVNLQLAPYPPANQPALYSTIASTTTGPTGAYTLTGTATREGLLRVEMPTTTTYPSLAVSPLIAVGALTSTDVGVGSLAVSSKLVLRKPSRKGRTVTLRGQIAPAVSAATAGTLVVQGRKAGRRHKFHALRKLRPAEGVAYKVSVKLKKGKWKLRVRYRDPGIVSPATSRAVSVSVR